MEDYEWFGVLVGDNLTDAVLSDGWFCDEKLTRELFEARQADPQYKNVMMVKVVATKQPWIRKKPN